MNELDILVVSYRARQSTANCLDSLALSTRPGYRLTVYDNTAENYPLSWIWQKFAEQSRREFIAILNPDVVVCRGWDTECVEAIRWKKTCIVAGPSANDPAHGDHEVPKCPDHIEVKDWLSVISENRSQKKVGTVYSQDIALLKGYCLIYDREALLGFGGFDWKKWPFYNNETEVLRNLLAAGKEWALCPRAVVWHDWHRCISDAHLTEKDQYGNPMPEFSTPPEHLC
jgi:GT2 family glycosyltransferase